MSAIHCNVLSMGSPASPKRHLETTGLYEIALFLIIACLRALYIVMYYKFSLTEKTPKDGRIMRNLDVGYLIHDHHTIYEI